jgi:hypothetical protein
MTIKSINITNKILLFVVCLGLISFVQRAFSQNKGQKETEKISINKLVDKNFEGVSFINEIQPPEGERTRGGEVEDILNFKPEINPKVDRYIGDITNGKRNGKGKYIWADGTIYDGNWKDDIMSGLGTMTDKKGDKYTGGWFNNKRNGQGTLILANGTKLIGIWKDNLLNGQGQLIKPNGDNYKGWWKDGNANGNGVFTWANGYKYEGEWKDGNPSGKGTLITKTNKKHTGIWKNGELAQKL